MNPKIYLAGPDVFFPDADAHFQELERLCADLGLQGLRPSDGGLSAGWSGPREELAGRIYRANVDLIRECDAVLANLMPFRGAIEPDSGTAFEVGFAVALGKPVAAHLPQPDLRLEEKVVQHCGAGARGPGGERFDATHGFLIEEFGLPLNLMLACSCSLHVSAAEALAHLKRSLSERGRVAAPSTDGGTP